MKPHHTFTPHSPPRAVKRSQRAAGWDGDVHWFGWEGSLQSSPRAEPEDFKSQSQFPASNSVPTLCFCFSSSTRPSWVTARTFYCVSRSVFFPSTRECRSVRKPWKTQDMMMQCPRYPPRTYLGTALSHLPHVGWLRERCGAHTCGENDLDPGSNILVLTRCST